LCHSKRSYQWGLVKGSPPNTLLKLSRGETFLTDEMGFNKVLVLLVFLGAAFAEKDAEAEVVGLAALNTVEGCIINCSAGGYHQHPTDCHKFIQCAPSGLHVLPCPEDTVWDQENTVCNHDDSVTCQTGEYLTPEGKPCPEVLTTLAPEVPTTPATPEECHFKCPEKYGRFAHPRDCKRYFSCFHRIPIPAKCPFGLHFNTKANRCTIPLLARCEATPDAEC